MMRSLPTTMFSVSGITKSYGAIRALDGVSFSLRDGELCGLIGPNGSGKTTLFDCCVSHTRPDTGSVQLGGNDVTNWSMDRIAREGRTVRTFQRTSTFGTMTVEENIAAAAQLRAVPSLARAFMSARSSPVGEEDLHERALLLLRMVDLLKMRDVPAAELSYGQQKLLQFVSAVVPRPRFVLLDEPFAGVNPVLMARMTELILWANEETGTGFLIIEHNVDALAALCPRIMVLHQGKLIGDGSAETILRDPAVVEAYLG